MISDMITTIMRFAVPVTVRRTDAGIVNAIGIYVPGADSTLTINACVQPANGRDIERLPEGMRTKDMYRIYSDALLYSAESPSGRPADVVEYKGDDLRVVRVERWGDVGNYTLALAERINDAQA